MTRVEEFVELFQCTERTDNYTDRPHADLWSGGYSPAMSTSDQGWARVERVMERIGFTFEHVEDWCDWPYRVVWRIPAYLAHVTYCEGDVSILVARSEVGFKAIDDSANRFYLRDTVA